MWSRARHKCTRTSLLHGQSGRPASRHNSNIPCRGHICCSAGPQSQTRTHCFCSSDSDTENTQNVTCRRVGAPPCKDCFMSRLHDHIQEVHEVGCCPARCRLSGISYARSCPCLTTPSPDGVAIGSRRMRTRAGGAQKPQTDWCKKGHCRLRTPVVRGRSVATVRTCMHQ